MARNSTAAHALTQLPGQDGCVRNSTGGTPQGRPSKSASGCRLVTGLIYPRRGDPAAHLDLYDRAAGCQLSISGEWSGTHLCPINY